MTGKRWWRSIRFRATVGAVVVVGVALVAASVALLLALRAGYVDRVRDPARSRAADVVEALDRGTPASSLRLDEGEDRFVQLVRDGEVLAASDTAAGLPALDGAEAVGISLPVGDADDEWLVVSADDGDGTTVVVGRELDPPLESVSTAAWSLAVGVPLLLVIVGGTTWLVVGRALAPVDAIRSEVDEIATDDRGGALERRVPVPGSGDEIARLATTMNAMLDRLEASRDRQRRFVADASHELRSPITTIRQRAEVARSHPDRTSVTELAGQVLGEDLRLQQLVDDLLLLARGDDADRGERRREVDLDDLLLTAAERARAAGSLEVDTTGIGAARAHGDERDLARVVDNLVDNAVRHARTTVRLVSREVDGVVVLEVHDDGAGIPPTERGRVTERFVRLDDARSRDGGGVGLGLAIVDQVVHNHDGTLTIGDSPLGGASMIVRLPIP